MSISFIEFSRIKSYFETLISNNLEFTIPQFKGELVNVFFAIKRFESDNNDKVKCKICEKRIDLKRMMLHIGQHILLGNLTTNSNTFAFVVVK